MEDAKMPAKKNACHLCGKKTSDFGYGRPLCKKCRKHLSPDESKGGEEHDEKI